jgi:hypothetical protein
MMRLALLLMLMLTGAAAPALADQVHGDFSVRIDPERHTLAGVARLSIAVPGTPHRRPLQARGGNA